MFYQLICISRPSGRPQDSPRRRCRIYCVLQTNLHFTHLREAAGLPEGQVPNICVLLTSLHFTHLREAAGLPEAQVPNILFYKLICSTSHTSGRPQDFPMRRCRIHCVLLTNLHFTHLRWDDLQTLFSCILFNAQECIRFYRLICTSRPGMPQDSPRRR